MNLCNHLGAKIEMIDDKRALEENQKLVSPVKIPFVIGMTGMEIPQKATKEFLDKLTGKNPNTPFFFLIDKQSEIKKHKDFLEKYKNNGEVIDSCGEAIEEHANLLVVLGDQGKSTELIQKWKNRLKTLSKPFPSHITDSIIFIDDTGIRGMPEEKSGEIIWEKLKKGFNRQDCRYENWFSHRKMFDVLDMIELYNKQVKAKKIPADTWVQQLGLINLLEKSDPKNSPDSFRIPQSEYTSILASRYKIADDFSYNSQKEYQKELTWLFVLSFGVGLMAQIYGGLNHSYIAQFPRIWGFTGIEMSLPIYILLFLVMLGYYFFIKLRKTDSKYVDFRFLAETLRVQIFWFLGKVQDEPNKIAQVANYIIPTNIAHLENASVVLHNWIWLDSRTKYDDTRCDLAVNIGWIDSQLNYYQNAIRKREKRRNKYKRIALISYIFSFLLAIGYFVFSLVEKSVQNTEGTYEIFHGFFWSLSDGIWLGIGPFVFAMIGYLIEKKGWEEEIESFKQSAKMFETIKVELEKPNANRNALLLVLGKEALKEHESWLKLHRNRKPSPNY